MQTSEDARRRKRARAAGRGSPGKLRREDWTVAAREALIGAGIDAVRVGVLARRLRVTRGSFYWHFKSRGALLKELLRDWERTNVEPFERARASEYAGRGLEEFLTFVNLWIEEKDYSPAFDAAMRDWARTSSTAAAAVRRADERRIAVLHGIFRDMGYDDPEATVRARVTYFHQVGYYALRISQDPAERRKLAPVYVKVLTGISRGTMERADGSSVSSIQPRTHSDLP